MKLHLKIKCWKLRKSLLKFMQIRTILYQYIKTLIKHVFLLNFTYDAHLRDAHLRDAHPRWRADTYSQGNL